MCLAQGPQPSDAGYRLEPATSRSPVKHSTTEPLRSLNILCEFNLSINLKSTFPTTKMDEFDGIFRMNVVSAQSKRPLQSQINFEIYVLIYFNNGNHYGITILTHLNLPE